MFRTFARHFLPNRLDWMVKRCMKKGGKKILLGWNRGLGDIALGLYAIVKRIKEFIPDAEITFLIRPNLREGFSFLEGVEVIVAPQWKRGEAVDVRKTLVELGIDPGSFDLIIEKPSPTDWVIWQRGRMVPKLQWNPVHENLWKKFDLAEDIIYIGVQVSAETSYGLWRNWPLEKWRELFVRLQRRANVKILLFGYGDEPRFSDPNLIDLRGKTTLFELLSIIKNKCRFLILPDSGISSMTYYLDASFPMHFISLWADADHGILKQNVPSPNPMLVHTPLIGERRDLSTVSVDAVMQKLFPLEPLSECPVISDVKEERVEKVACILLAGGQGTRLGASLAKGLYEIGGKTLFEWICSKMKRADLPIAVMTSPLNHQETVAFFERHSFFGLDVHFFQQEMDPVLDEEKKAIEIRPGEIVKGPNGNGSVFRSFVRSGLAEKFQKQGIELISILPVDNPVADPFDPALISYAHQKKADVVVKCIERRVGENSVGVLALRDGRIEIAEYTEISPEEMRALDEEGRLKYQYANSGLFIFNLSFMMKMGSIDLPVHWVKKKMQIGPQVISVWKGEHFIFDVFPYASQIEVICAPRETCYASLKSKENLEEIENALKVR